MESALKGNRDMGGSWGPCGSNIRKSVMCPVCGREGPRKQVEVEGRGHSCLGNPIRHPVPTGRVGWEQ